MIEFRILGPLEAERGGALLALGGHKQRAVLAVLLLHHGEVVSSDRLADEVWGEEQPATVAHTLQVYVSNLRKVLGEGAPKGERQHLATRPPGYLLQLEPDELDLFRFERLVAEGRDALATGDARTAADRLRAALGLWRGPALADFTYEPFAQSAIARLEELRLAALEDRIDAELALGRHGDLVGELEALIAESPLRERPRGQLMLALYRAGRQAEALDAYQAARRALVEELGIDPSPALQRLEKAILVQDAGLELEPPTEVERPAAKSGALERSILVLPLEAGALDRLLAVAEPLARSQSPHELILARLLDPSRSAGLPAAASGLNARKARLAKAGVPARAAAFTSRDPGADAVRLASEQGVDLLLLDCPPSPLATGSFGAELDQLLSEAPSDVALLVDREARAPGGYVLVPFGGTEHEWSALELGGWIASVRGVDLRMLGTEEDTGEGRRDASRLLAAAAFALQQVVDVAAAPMLGGRGGGSVVEAAAEAALVVVGLSPRWRSDGLGAARLSIANGAPAPVLLVRRGLRPGGLAPADSLTRFTWSLGDRG
jgi:DNA-binding SARP family transcriptional activator